MTTKCLVRTILLHPLVWDVQEDFGSKRFLKQKMETIVVTCSVCETCSTLQELKMANC